MPSCPTSLLLVVEGANDYEFLVRLAARLRDDDPSIPDLQELCAAGQIVILPAGGGDPAAWAERLAPLGLAQFHLYDREQEPQTQERLQALIRVTGRPGCWGALLAKRSLENYLHPAAIRAAGGGDLVFGDDDPVARLVAQQRYAAEGPALAWEQLPHRAQRRFTHRAKRWLNRAAAQQMTAALLAARDLSGELKGLLRRIGELAGAGASSL